MEVIWERSRMIAIAVVILFGAVAIAVARPHAISEPILGMNWQCSRAAFVVTCTHDPLLPRFAPTAGAAPDVRASLGAYQASLPNLPSGAGFLARETGAPKAP
jgi:hypothetical protein